MPLAKPDGININYEVDGHGGYLVVIMGFAASPNDWMSPDGFI